MDITKINDQQFDQIISQNEKVLIKFFANWCGVCKAFAPEFERMIQEEQYKDFKVVEIEAPENPKSRLASGVYSLPFFATYYQGKQIGKCPSADKRQVAELMDELAQATADSLV